MPKQAQNPNDNSILPGRSMIYLPTGWQNILCQIKRPERFILDNKDSEKAKTEPSVSTKSSAATPASTKKQPERQRQHQPQKNKTISRTTATTRTSQHQGKQQKAHELLPTDIINVRLVKGKKS